jgi:AraC family transcriptional regulator
MQNQRFEILQARRPSEVLGGVQPILSSSNSNFDGLLIESYRVKEFGPTPRFCYTDHHMVSIQRDGVANAVARPSEKWCRGTASIIPVRSPETNITFSNVTVMVAMLDPGFIREAVGGAIDADGMELIPYRSPRNEQLERLVLAAVAEVESGLSIGSIFLESVGTALAAHLLTHHATKRVVAKERGNSMPRHLMSRAIEFIRENLGKNLSLAEISAVVDMSPYHFCRLFKRGTGFSPHQYVRVEKINRARHLLKEHQLSLVEIANELGFSDQSHFTRTFRAVVGVTPSRYSASV